MSYWVRGWTWFKLGNWTWETWIRLIQELNSSRCVTAFHCLTPFFVKKSAVDHLFDLFLNSIWRSPHTYTHTVFDADVDVCLFEDLKRQLQALLEARQAHVMLFGTCGSVHNIHVWNQSMPIKATPTRNQGFSKKLTMHQLVLYQSASW